MVPGKTKRTKGKSVNLMILLRKLGIPGTKMKTGMNTGKMKNEYGEINDEKEQKAALDPAYASV